MSRYAIGIDLGGTNIASGIVDLENGTIVVQSSIKTRAPRPPEQIVDDMVAEVKALCRSAGIEASQICRLGVATPGIVKDGAVLSACNLGWTDAPLCRLLKEKSGIEHCYVANDANAAALAEAVFGAGKGARSLAALTIGTGIGGGIVLNGRIWEGFNGFAAELGHITIEKGGLECGCGKRGCLESYCSATALVRETRRVMKLYPESKMWHMCEGLEKVSGKTAFRAAEAGDEAAALVLEEFFENLAIGVSNIINLIQPEVMVIGGGISREGDTLLVPVNKRVRRLSFGAEGMRTRVVAATFRGDAGILGASLLDEN